MTEDSLLREARHVVKWTPVLGDLVARLVLRIEALEAELTEVKARLEARTGET